MPTARWLEGRDLFDAWKEPWQRLVSEAQNATPFQTFEWQSTWFNHFGGRKQPLLLGAFEGNDLVGLWPFVRSAGSWPTLRPMGKGSSDYLHPILRKHAEGVEGAFADALNERKDEVVDLHQLREDFVPDLVAKLTGLHQEPIPQARCLVLELDTSYDAYVQSLGKSLRYDVRRLQKPPFSNGEAKIELAARENVSETLEHLFRLHAMRWRKRWQPGAFPRPLRNFHLEWAHLAEQRGWLSLSILVAEGEPIGALYAMNLNQATYYYQAGMDPSKNAISPGTLLVADAIRLAIERGDKRFDFLRGDEAYKQRWKPQHTFTNSRYLCGRASGRTGLGLQWNQLGSRVEAKVRARLEAR